MKLILQIVTLVLCTLAVSGQKNTVNEYAAVDKIALQLPDSLAKTTEGIAGYIAKKFPSAKDQARAVFSWLGTNIQYDVENMYAINFYEKQEEKIARALKTRKGICENYAAIFKDICTQLKIRSYVIEGYTRQAGDVSFLPHAWCSAYIDSAWYMFDPTWGSGYINGGRFYRKINNQYFKAPPATLIKSHMPFDYLWQFNYYPVTNQEFYDGKTQLDKSKPFFNFPDSIRDYEALAHAEQLAATARRIEKNGVKNSMLFDRLQHIRLELEQEKQNEAVSTYNSATYDFNDAVRDFNKFIEYRNKQFIPAKTDVEIQSMIDTVDSNFKKATAKLASIKSADSNIISAIQQLTKSINEADVHLKEQKDWLSIYFSKSKSKRKAMFYDKKATLFGISLN